MQYFGWNSSEGMNKARNTAWCFFYFSEGVFYMQDVYCENCLFGLVERLGGEPRCRNRVEKLGGKTGWKDWVEGLGVETRWTDWVEKPSRKTGWKDWGEKLDVETGWKDWVVKPDVEDALVKYLFQLV